MSKVKYELFTNNLFMKKTTHSWLAIISVPVPRCIKLSAQVWRLAPAKEFDSCI